MNEFIPPILLRNPHLQSLLSSAKIRRPMLQRKAKEMLSNSICYILDCGKGVRLQGYYSGHKNQTHCDLAILIHGWEGSADSLYILSAADYLYRRRFDIFRLNLRDHGTSHHLNPELFHSCRIDEVVGAVRQIQEMFPRNRIFLGGFSLGGNFALRVALRAKEAGIYLTKTAAVCPVLNPAGTLNALETGCFLYRRYFLKKWRRSLRTKRLYFPDIPGLDDLSRFGTLTEMTDFFVRGHTGFADMKQYLNGYSITGNVLAKIAVPAHIIASADDPVIPADDLNRLALNPYLSVEILKYGGHCGFIENYRFRSWADRRMADFFKS